MTRDELKDALRGMLRDTLQARFEGGRYADLARAHGYADGYMRALLDTGVLDQAELLQLVSRERRRFVDDAQVGVTGAVA
ncbi:MAG: hypothetical protein R3B40_17725 [Polyangiales bacterium]|nr:hypothetical protein [Myxococcales bacterium]MCB9661335.1 hypothetical protein [Sandaracinaceae bacterium]